MNGFQRDKLPRWQELPDLGLYMDQVLYLIGLYQPACAQETGQALTASMVHNYVKLKVMPPPDKKKYNRVHLAYLIMICQLKPVLPLNGIAALIREELQTRPMEALYDAFCMERERTRAAVEARLARDSGRKEELPDVFSAALMSAAERQAALQLMAETGVEP